MRLCSDMHINLTECTLHEKNLMTITAKLTKGSENPSVFFEFCNKYSVSFNCVGNPAFF